MDKEDRELLATVEAGEWKPIKDMETQISEYKKIAQAKMSVPTRKTVKAIEDSREGKGESFASSEELFENLAIGIVEKD